MRSKRIQYKKNKRFEWKKSNQYKKIDEKNKVKVAKVGEEDKLERNYIKIEKDKNNERFGATSLLFS
jgi:hypothetical protein